MTGTRPLFLALAFVLINTPLSHAAEPLTIVALGDSTTAGTPEGNYSQTISKLHPEWHVINSGVNAERTDQILKRFESDVLVYHPQVLIVLAGVNDLYQGRSAEEAEKNLAKIYESAARANIRVIACTILPYDRSTPDVKARMKEVNDWIRAYANQKGLGFCDTYSALEDPARAGHLIGSPDGLHPDAAAYEKMGHFISKMLEKEIEKETLVFDKGGIL